MTDDMVCAICDEPVEGEGRKAAMCWADPHGVTCVAHHDCLVRIGEFDLGLKNSGWGH